MKKFLITAAAIGLLTTTAQAQLMLPPPPPTQYQTDLANLTMVKVYAVNCKAKDPDFDDNGDVGVAISWTYNRRFPAMQNLGQIEAAAKRAKDMVTEIGLAKFCTMADQDADMQAMVKLLRAWGASR